jgi:hypothetical protein
MKIKKLSRFRDELMKGKEIEVKHDGALAELPKNRRQRPGQ